MTTQSPTSSTTRLSSIGLVAAVYLLLATQICGAAYYGKLIGKLSELHHGVSGEVYAVDGRTLFIKDFTYDGEAPTAYFYVGTSKSPNGNGIRLRDESGSSDTLKRYRRKDITLTLPDGKTMANIKWFAVWCDEFSVNFGDVRIPRGFDYPKPQKLAALNGVHGVSSEPIVVVDAQTLLIPSFSYDGEAPDAKFWVGAGPTPSPQGIRVPDENGKEQPLRRYDRKAIVLTLPGDVTIHQIGHFGVWCEAFAVDFGHVQIPQGLNVPPSLKMLGVSPQSKLNCEVLEDRLAFEVRWAVAGDSIVAQLVGKLDDGQYMAFGLSADPERSSMVGGDAVVAWVDKQTLQGYAVDYFLDAKSQCSGGRGSCPDTRIQENTNSIRLLNAALVDGYSIVTYQRPLKTNDELDHQILTNRSQPIIWAVGPLNERQEVSFHSDYLKTDRFIDFGRPPIWNCPVPDHEPSQIFTDQNDDKPDQQQLVATTRRPYRTPATPAPAPKTGAWEIPPIQCNEPEDGVLYAQMGPTGGKHGYPAITGHVGWGISWYINGLLIPEINVVRGKKYRFVVEGGENPETPARYHPFYITDDPVGGYQHKTPEEKEKVKIFAGVKRQRGVVRPTGVGRLCNWLPDQNQPLADDFTSFGAYQRTLTLECDHGEPGIVEWIPDEDTPDTVYYQCFTHRYLGWKINVHDSCDVEPAGNENHEIYVDPKKGGGREDLEISPSIREASKTAHTMPQPTLALPPRSIFMERKKTVYRPPPSSSSSSSSSYTARRTAERLPSSQGSQDELQIAKLKKIERAKLETKASSSFDAPDIFVTPIKPARNTGFDPDSIVIESGFKPIIRNVESVAQKRSSGQEEEEEEEEEEDETSNRKPTVDNFEPVFIPSPPVPTVATVVKKSRKKSANGKPRATETDDMEAAADRMNVHYLPPISNPFPNNEPPPFPSSSSGVLITFDGKMLKDSSLVRSISGVEEQSKGKLSSDVLSRTPQFGRFKGELPPPIPGEVRSLEDHSRLSDLSMPRTTKNTRLTLVERSKRSPHEGQSVTDFTRTNSSSETNQRGKNSISTITPPVNTGQTIVFNSLYLVLAIIVCHVI
ncbi:protein Skeletor, isoforms B/C isoform X3 [Apis mellifera]|uniref:Protein Skeletor, isoforms B/C isoform X3 n=1 Tax=Apis mellifera TaxID=7460 RepID=A0A7M7MVB5_APIME|nr:protein Skeletor, isoforms B/C isoform X3 [Apis mellifera]|eukprot:XP_026301104.1 protein Skeletor, isoforms B/C isoform X3 [Apis mellifera]